MASVFIFKSRFKRNETISFIDFLAIWADFGILRAFMNN